MTDRIDTDANERAAALASRRGIDMPSAQGPGHPTPAEMRAARRSIRRFMPDRLTEGDEP